MSALKEVWVFGEHLKFLPQLCAGGHELGDKVSALIVGPKSEAEEAIKMGADQVYWLGEMDSTKMLEDYILTMYNLISDKQPDLVLFATSRRAKLIAGSLAVRFGTSVLADVMEFAIEDDKLQAKRMVYGGAAIRIEQSSSQVVIATVGSGVFKASADCGEGQGNIEAVAFVEAQQKIKCKEKKPKAGVSVNLGAAKRIVAVGRGIAKQEDLKMVEEFAALIGAEIGCSRPISEGENWMPRELYIGVSGVMQLKPEIYIAVGISGQIQHMVGCNQAQTLYAINTDKNAPIFKQCDYGVIGDLYKVLPILIEKVKASK